MNFVRLLLLTIFVFNRLQIDLLKDVPLDYYWHGWLNRRKPDKHLEVLFVYLAQTLNIFLLLEVSKVAFALSPVLVIELSADTALDVPEHFLMKPVVEVLERGTANTRRNIVRRAHQTGLRLHVDY